MADSARDVAVKALRDRSGNVSAHVRRILSGSTLSHPEKALATELALGVVRRRATLEAMISALLTRPGQSLPSALREILNVAVYQILFLDRVPDFAAVSEAVNQAHRLGKSRQSGLVNGVLRSLLRELSEPIEGKAPPQPDVIQISSNVYRKLGRPVFPDPESDAAAYLAAAGSIPGELANRWIDRFKTLNKALAYTVHANTRAPLIVRVNTLKTNLQDLVSALTQQGAAVSNHENGVSLVIEGFSQGQGLTDIPAFREGLIQPQDPTATAVGFAMGVNPGMKVLDVCAAPGTKTTHLAELMHNEGEIIAIDVSQEKTSLIESNCSRMGISIVKTMQAEAAGSLEPGWFDAVLVDAPCSNTGVLARRPEARWRFSKAGLSKLVDDQKSIAQIASLFVRPGGRLVYSTCSIESEECGQVARWLCKQSRHLSIVKEKLTLPGGADDMRRWHDGGYFAIIQT